ncbi:MULTISPECIES: DotH/IcmK family type IV secretion protein [unclassified Pseudomonas]|uniref:DotH/IcmK family type IV secretion protein n=1 Tax=unclassified Pseudomonas TaxID=196821 RepID=UPI000B664709|nr:MULTISPECIES: DotH/IcmK family type IV secretion protein [Pseudomonas]SNS30973.1 intracellular multiplication protein IcmK [Pseudomonas sp. LAMO17WK12:I8]SNX99984.1 intracellular multiplication protein IcmK [Pseudomonas sp. LAMO17WK12:I12]SNY00437.1 intracellular multiplication protein IcmK [Pseudomonas sp. LAMO17WK12:I11]SNY03515.1 intracellular multiplication protein IcmK [Pseudomonas sp. LAMO17WK12:I7]
MKKHLIASLLASAIAMPAFANEAQNAPAAEGSVGQFDAAQGSDAPPLPPMNGLGRQVSSVAQVVYPRPEDVISDTVQDVQDSQLTSSQVELIKQLWLEREKQKATAYVSPAKPVTRTLALNLDPGVSPPIVRLSKGQQSSIVFSDYAGQPWMIQNVSINRELFSDGRERGGQNGQGGNVAPTNILTLDPATAAAYGNVTVTLRGLATPIILILAAGQEEVDMRVDAKVPGRNPDAEATVAMLGMPSIDDALTYFLDGVPPKEANRLKVTGLEGVEAWSYGPNMYVKAKADAQYPAYTNAARSTTGVAVYRYAGLQNSVTFTTGGQAVTVFIEQGNLQ